MNIRLNNDRGSALVLVTLITLVLAAIAIVALRNVSRTIQQSAVYQTRQQAMLTSTGATNLFAKRVGDKASLVYNRMTSRMYQEESTDNDTFVLGGSRDLADRKNLLRSGQYALFRSSEFNDFLPTSSPESGLFTDGTAASFEQQSGRTTTFRTIVRDPMDAQAATGFDNSYCFKKVTLASEATVGATPCDANGDCSSGDICRGGVASTTALEGFCDDGWKRLNTISQTRNGMEGLIGPIECGY